MFPTDEPGFKGLLTRVENIIAARYEIDDTLQVICELLRENVPHYDWVGFYLVGDEPNVLELGPYAGSPTEHLRIPFGRGICGQAAERRETFLAQDVEGEENYLACSPEVKSEFVVPIMRNGQVLGELDVDSHAASPFTDEDRKFLEDIAALVCGVL